MSTFIKAVFKGKCAITFDFDGGTSTASNTMEVPRGTTWAKIKDTVTAPTKEGNTFKHWSTTQGGDAITDGYKFMDSAVSIYAVWEIVGVTISFDLDGGSPDIENKTVGYGTTWAQIKDSVTAPSKTGYNFTHWSTSAGGTAIGDEVVFNTDTTIYAVYSVIRVTVSFNPDGGSPTPDPQVVDYGTTWAQIKDSVTAPSKTGYTFLGWEVA